MSDRKRINILKQNIKLGDIVLDIGGNIGFYSLLLARLVGVKGEVHVFEPDPVNYKHLRMNTRKYPNIKTYNVAAGANTAIIKLYCSEYLNVDHQTYDSCENRNSIEVQCVSIDNYLNHIIKVDFVKIDVQGFDYQVILGMKRIIAASNNIKILGEFWPYGLKKAGTSVNEYIELLFELDFSIEFFDDKIISYPESLEKELNYYTDFWACKKSSENSTKTNRLS
ncbi:MAG: FkbM family methyltransferase [Candidatus Paceibacterota bacterium]